MICSLAVVSSGAARGAPAAVPIVIRLDHAFVDEQLSRRMAAGLVAEDGGPLVPVVRKFER